MKERETHLRDASQRKPAASSSATRSSPSSSFARRTAATQPPRPLSHVREMGRRLERAVYCERRGGKRGATVDRTTASLRALIGDSIVGAFA